MFRFSQVLACVVLVCTTPIFSQSACANESAGESAGRGVEFFERRIRPLLIEHCYECHSEEHREQQGGLLLDRASGWLSGGDTGKAVVPYEVEASLLIRAVRYEDGDLQMPPDGKLSDPQIKLLEDWIHSGAPGPKEDMGETEFSQLGDQEVLFAHASDHWAFQPVEVAQPSAVKDPLWNRSSIDRLVYAKINENGLKPSPLADARTLCRRLHYDLLGLPPTPEQVERFVEGFEGNAERAISDLVARLLQDPAFGQHFARVWLDVVRYADTDSTYRPDTKTPHYFPFAFTYRDYVVDSLNADKPYDQFLLEQFAADQLGYESGDPEIAALGFFGVGPFANRTPNEALDDWIDLTTRGLMGLTVACARCHDHKYEPIPTIDYYSLRGLFSGVKRIAPLDLRGQPRVGGYVPTDSQRADFESRRASIMQKIEAAGNSKARGNNRSVAQKIRETELAELLTFHQGGPALAMAVADVKTPPRSVVFVRGDPSARGELAPMRFLKILDAEQAVFSTEKHPRLQLAERIIDPENPLTARVLVNRIWGAMMGSYLVATPSDFGLQGSPPTHPRLLDHLASEFVSQGWSIKRLIHSIATSRSYLQGSGHREGAAEIDPSNRWYWRANRKRLSIEELRDSVLAVSGQLDRSVGGRAAPLWGEDYSRRRTIYGFVNRFNLDPTLRAFDFPTPMQSQPRRDESIVASQALFTLNSPFVVEQSIATTQLESFLRCESDAQRIEFLFRRLLQRKPALNEMDRVERLVAFQTRLKPSKRFQNSPWPMIAQAIVMSNEFQYYD